MNKKTFAIITAIILFAALSRLLPHPTNFTPVAALILFGAAYFTNKKWALIIPLTAIWLSDLLLNNIVYSTYNRSEERRVGKEYRSQRWRWDYEEKKIVDNGDMYTDALNTT